MNAFIDRRPAFLTTVWDVQPDASQSYVIEWAEEAAHLATTAEADAVWNALVAREIVLPTDRLALDVGCGGGGMALALAGALPVGASVVGIDGDAAVLDAARSHLAEAGPVGERVRLVQASLEDGLADAAGGKAADLVWASASVHHLGDQQAAVSSLAGLLALGGRLALAEGGLAPSYLPWDVGVGGPGLEHRLTAAGHEWFAQMRGALPGSVRMPYGWPEAMRRAGLGDVRTRTVLFERPAPLAPPERSHVAHLLRTHVDRVAGTGLLSAADLDAWTRLLDPADEAWLGGRADVQMLSARSVHVGVRSRLP